MASQTDFLALYQRLGVRADCSEAEFKNAYRRLIAELHPDRKLGQGDLVEAALLKDMIAGYNAAMAFRRRHGRLPGAARPTPPPMRREALAAAYRQSLPAAKPEPAPTHAPLLRPGPIAAGLALAALAGAALWSADAYFDGIDETPPPESSRVEYRDAASMRESASRVGEARTEPHLELGLDVESVLAIQGRPLAQNSRRWDYGPSWIAFENGRVSDWYSSPLHPLKALLARPSDPPDRLR